MKFSKKTVFLCTAAAVIIAAVIVLFLCFLKKPVVAFCGLNEKQKEALTSLPVFYRKNGKCAFKFVELDAAAPLEEQLKKSRADLLFAFQSRQLDKCAAPLLESRSRRLGVSGRLLDSYTESARSCAAFSKAGRVVKLPVANDFVSPAFDSNFTKEFGIEEFNSLGDVGRYLRDCKKNVRSPMIFAGAEKTSALDLAGIFCEAVSGPEYYKKAVLMCEEYLAGGKNSAFELAEILCDEENGPLYEGLKVLKEWFSEGYFYQDVFSMSYSDVYEYMKRNSAPMVILPLSARRAARREIVKHYVSSYFPSDHYGARTFMAPVLFALCRSGNRAAVTAASKLALSEMQEIYCVQSGLAPVIASCKTADVQADDARYWVAASAKPVAGLAEDAFEDAAFAAELSEIIKRTITR